MSNPLIRNSSGFSQGLTALTTIGEEHDTQMNFGVLKLSKGQSHSVNSPLEHAFLLLMGDLSFSFCGESKRLKRASVFDDAPIALHVCPHDEIKLSANSDCEIIALSTENEKRFKTTLFTEQNMLENEHRGKGLLNDTAYRMVRTIFDARNRPDANLVLGEVITFPGKWSSYPPHHHPQPEIYHYRFSEEQGYGHAELGEQVFKVKNGDTIKILDELDHAQVSAPGYAMMYVWAIRHLAKNPYSIPEFTKSHAWTKSSEANRRVWQPN